MYETAMSRYRLIRQIHHMKNWILSGDCDRRDLPLRESQNAERKSGRKKLLLQKKEGQNRRNQQGRQHI